MGRNPAPVASFNVEINRLDNRMIFIPKKECCNKEITYQTQIGLLVLILYRDPILTHHEQTSGRDNPPEGKNLHHQWTIKINSHQHHESDDK